ncbi:MAG TPA: hypothetical protein PLP88_05475 [Bacteroidales bacterium]|nr:hypothetical protein [Bacteroidales bacterium]
MKNVLLILVLVPIFCYSQKQEITGFMGLKLGCSKEEAFKVLSERQTENPILFDSLNYSYVIPNVNFYGTIFTLILHFYDNKLYSGIFSVTDLSLIEAQELFNNFKRKYDLKYGIQDVTNDMARWVDKVNSTMILIAFKQKNSDIYFQIGYTDINANQKAEKAKLKDL